MDNIIKYVLLFFFYSFGGWCLESTYCSIGEKKLINRGFLTGPLCPIYGTAAVVMAVFLYPFKDIPLVVFLLGIVVCDVVEYMTSLIMEKLFSARWWDYTYEFMNLNGRISLKHSLHWGVVSVVFVLLIHPAVEKLYYKIDADIIKYLLIAILLIFAADVVNAVRKAADFRKLQSKIKSVTETLSDLLGTVGNAIGDKYSVIQSEIAKKSDKITDFKLTVEEITLQLQESLTPKFRRNKDKKNNLSARLVYNNPELERYVNNQLKKINALIDDIKANIYEGEEKL